MDRLSQLGGAGLLVFFATYDQKMTEYANGSPLISNPDSYASYVNPFNYIVENAALLEAFAAAYEADRQAAEEDSEDQNQP